jgi:hypothetical protein
VNAVLDTTTYDRGVKITDKQIAAPEATQLHRHEFHGDWNYTLTADHTATPLPGGSVSLRLTTLLCLNRRGRASSRGAAISACPDLSSRRRHVPVRLLRGIGLPRPSR